MTSTSRSHRGFSLMELLVVLFIVGILAAVGVYRLTPRSKPLIRQLTEQLLLTMNEGRQLARATGRQVTLHMTGTSVDNLKISLEYVDPGVSATTYPGGQFSMAGQPTRVKDHAVPGIGVSQLESVQPNLASIRELGIIPDFDLFFVARNNPFQESENRAFSFSSAGQINQSLFMTVSHPSGMRGSAFGLVIVTPNNGVHAFFLGGADESWKRI